MDSGGSCPSVRAHHVLLRVLPNGPILKRYVDQLRPRYGVEEDGEVPGPSLTSHPLEKDSALPQHTLPSNNFQEPVQVQPRGRPKGRRNFQPSLPGHLREPLTLPRRSERLRQKALHRFMAGGEVL